MHARTTAGAPSVLFPPTSNFRTSTCMHFQLRLVRVSFPSNFKAFSDLCNRDGACTSSPHRCRRTQYCSLSLE